MSTTLRAIVFGTVSGLIWSVVAAVLSGLFQSVGADVTVFISGILTGILVSLVMKYYLQISRHWCSSVFLGAVSLPFGAFAFGVVISVIQLMASKIAGGTYPMVEPYFNPFGLGCGYALVSVASLFAVGLFPLAILTTFVLRAVIH